ncbi:hypothetical protein E5288_WYG010394 [Bos mutus]|uniref:A-type potassium channel modulatory protein DPP6 n=1 Tax=Bos mutus TaxID=72004 RepID=A0A6B0S448_9CETA|nr:hypothetical protein [Bos mutus]
MDYSGSLWQTLKPPLGHEPSSERVLRASWRNGSCSVRVDPGPCLTVWMEGIHNQEGRLFSRTCEDRVLGTHHIYQHSYTGYYVLSKIPHGDPQSLDPPEVSNAKLQYAGWGPKGQQLIFIFENNIYYCAHVGKQAIRVVSTGKEGVIYNGLSDWLYEVNTVYISSILIIAIIYTRHHRGTCDWTHGDPTYDDCGRGDRTCDDYARGDRTCDDYAVVTLPVMTVPMVTVPVTTVPVVTLPVMIVPVVTVPVTTVPVVTLPVTTVSVVTIPVMTVPVVTLPVTTVPVVTVPVTTVPVVTLPVTTVPVVTVSVMTVPVVTVPVTTVPVVTLPVMTVPVVTVPVTTVPVVTLWESLGVREAADELRVCRSVLPVCSWVTLLSRHLTGTCHCSAEEILKTHIAHWWSPDGTRLAYATINDSRVPVMELPTYTGSIYPTAKPYHYPKAGCENPSISLHVIGLNGPTHDLEMTPPDDPRMREYYITMVKWATSTKVAVNWLSRAQNVSILTLCDATTGVCTKKHEDESEAWLHRQNEEPVFSKDGRKFFFVRAIPQGGQGKFYHITVSSSQPNSSNDNIQSITSGDWDVTKILSYDEKRSQIYFLSTEDLPRRRQLYRCAWDVTSAALGSCRGCVILSSDVAVRRHVKRQGIREWGSERIIGLSVSEMFDLETNEHVQKAISDRQMPKVEYRKIETDDYNLPIQILKPATFTDTAHYPLLLVVDGTPGSQSVAEKFAVTWETVMVSSHGAVVVKCDGRGSGFQGTRLLHEVRRRLGSLEEKDQMEAMRVMLKEPYIDKTRVAVFGKVSCLLGLSGGFTPAISQSEGPRPRANAPLCFRPASAFSERYLGLHGLDNRAYEMAKVAHRVSALEGQQFLVIHATADEKIHFQHTAELITQLIKGKANYSLQIYPDESHYFSSAALQQHLHRSILGFFVECFRIQDKLPAVTAREDEEED